jgi:osmotically inducible lipoprotein OsmB
MKKIVSGVIFSLFLGSILMFIGCSKREQNTALGAGIGTAAGVAVGAAAGGTKGAFLGGALGGITGGLIGNTATKD